MVSLSAPHDLFDQHRASGQAPQPHRLDPNTPTEKRGPLGQRGSRGISRTRLPEPKSKICESLISECADCAYGELGGRAKEETALIALDLYRAVVGGGLLHVVVAKACLRFTYAGSRSKLKINLYC